MTTNDPHGSDSGRRGAPLLRRGPLWSDRAAAWAASRFAAARGDRGDVPGWVLVTLMTAGLVTALWLIAEPALKGVFSSAISDVTKK
ncbi:hypothetical protein [Cellulomonas alba]|uniref:Uncharacterized protein n=1 Tax=Cellulomonas alba TaxID=3053467 RepID=A0ABT7SM91_9CELL|nr:hypothetical protein [Cellulomonas alba]MDM7856634.1 hypothetical protein [Cellulomonas alba]